MPGERGGEVDLGLLVLRPEVAQVLRVAELLERLAEAGNVAVAEDSPDARDEPLLASVALDVLLGEEPDDGLTHGQSDGAHRSISLAQPIATKVSSALRPRQHRPEGTAVR